MRVLDDEALIRAALDAASAAGADDVPIGAVIVDADGESLINDAAALTLFSFAVAHVAGTKTFIENPVALFGYSAVVG
ncbi:hypothetical protein, partial [Mycolicibacterium insubricum]|uniref:hypothetical protein n=1 Tax=Mycolicibacterium insubricum TaxID=444597 RepID=UPI0021F33CB3